jgi:hypothetical protein
VFCKIVTCQLWRGRGLEKSVVDSDMAATCKVCGHIWNRMWRFEYKYNN